MQRELVDLDRLALSIHAYQRYDVITLIWQKHEHPTMSNLSKRSTIYFDPAIHKALKSKAVSTETSLSELVNEAVRLLMSEDEEDLPVISTKAERSLSYTPAEYQTPPLFPQRISNKPHGLKGPLQSL